MSAHSVASPSELRRFLSDPQSLVCAVAADAAESVFGRAPWPAGWIACGTNALRECRLYDSAFAAGQDETARLYLVRNAPLQLAFEVADASSRDDFECRLSATAEFRVSGEPSLLRAFCDRILGSRPTARAEDLGALLRPKAVQLLRAFAGQEEAGELVDGKCDTAFAQLYCDGLAPLLFECGLTFGGTPALHCESESFSRHRREHRRVREVRQRQAWLDEIRQCQRQARERHLQHLEPLLDRLQQLAGNAPDLELRDLVRTFTEQQRAEIYEALFKLRPPQERTARVVVASAGELTALDPTEPAAGARRVRMNGAAGQLRSVRCGRDQDGQLVLVIGARRGVYVLDVDMTGAPQTFCLPEEAGRLRGGFNSATLDSKDLLASHSEVGVIRWRIDEPDKPEPLLTEQTHGAEAIRHIRRVGEHVWLSIDHRVLRLPADDLRAERAICYEGNTVPVTALHVDKVRVIAGTQTGQLLMWELDKPSEPCVLEHGRGRPIGSVRTLPSEGLDRLIFADYSPGITARFLEDALACRYQSGGEEFGRAMAADDLIIAVNTQRDRMFLWHPYEPAAPYAVVPVALWTGHSIQDASLIPHSG
jgi:hypothetical protein